MQQKYFMVLYVGVILAVTNIAFVATAIVRYTDCGHGEIEKIQINPCVKEPCNFKAGDRVNVTVDFVANHDTKKVSLYGTLRTGGFFNYEIPYLGVDHEACGENKLPCPLISGKRYNFTVGGVVPQSSRFNIFRYATWKLVGDNYRTLTCAEIPIF